MKNINFNNIQIKPISNDREFEEAGQIIDRLVDADLIEDPSDRAKALNLLEAIAILAHEYEKKNFPMPTVDPMEALKERILLLNLPPKELVKNLGEGTPVFQALEKKRPFTLAMIKTLYRNLHIPAEILLRAV